jgi:hypothetical protein
MDKLNARLMNQLACRRLSFWLISSKQKLFILLLYSLLRSQRIFQFRLSFNAFVRSLSYGFERRILLSSLLSFHSAANWGIRRIGLYLAVFSCKRFSCFIIAKILKIIHGRV